MFAFAVVRTSDGPSAETVIAFMDTWTRTLQRLRDGFVAPGIETLMAASPDPTSMLGLVAEARRTTLADPRTATVSYRASMHVGSVGIVSGGALVGTDAALCTRILQEARTGQALVSEACAGLVRHALPAGFALHDCGERQLVGFDQPVRLFELWNAGPTREAPETERRSSQPIRILLVEDERMLREALAGLLKLDPGFDLVGSAPNGRLGVERALELQPDVVLMDLDMPELNGIEATRRIRQARPETQVLILTKFGDDESVFEAIRAGALGYMLKDAGIEEIGRVVRSIHAGEGYLSPTLVPRVMHEFSRITRSAAETRALFAELSRREVEVLELVGQGMRNRAIAARLFISEKTVKNHISNILAKLQLNDRTAAALLAREHGLTPSP
jgi:DNA-binding NarL/FixJ family response regulator